MRTAAMLCRASMGDEREQVVSVFTLRISMHLKQRIDRYLEQHRRKRGLPIRQPDLIRAAIEIGMTTLEVELGKGEFGNGTTKEG